MTDEELARIKRETVGATDTEHLAPSDVWGLIRRLEAAEAVCRHAECLQEGDGFFTVLLEAWKRARGDCAHVFSEQYQDGKLTGECIHCGLPGLGPPT